jgi:heme/copper-type cytochrome/quinol oxidase subunit 3
VTPLVDARRTRAADAGMWLFLASLVMFYASLYSGYVLLRAGSETWTTPWLARPIVWGIQPFVVSSTLGLALVFVVIRQLQLAAESGAPRSIGVWLPTIATSSLTLTWWDAARAMLAAGSGPATSVAAASWFVLTGALALGVLGGGLVATWWAWRDRQSGTPAHALRQLQRYWGLMLVVWFSIVIGMYVV